MRRFTRSFFSSRLPKIQPIRRLTRPVLERLESRETPSVSVLSYHNDLSSTGQNLLETSLTPSNVNVNGFGKAFSLPVDGQVYAQPLVMAGVNVTTGPQPGTHDVVFVATENDSLYAFDANTGALLWQNALLPSQYGGTVTAVPSNDVNSGDLSPEIGITSTPVIDPNTKTLYLEEKTKEVTNGVSHYLHWLQAIDVSNGAPKFGGPVVIADSIGDTYVSGPIVNGTGDTAAGLPSGEVGFDALRQMNRVGLSLSNGNIYLGYASHGDNEPYNGWVLAFSASTLKATGVFCATPNGSEAGIWQSGGRIVVDSSGFLFLETGNGTFDETLNAQGFPINGDYGDSFVKLAIDPTTNAQHQNINGWGLKVADYFTPQNEASLSGADEDLGSGGPLLLPASAGNAAHKELLVGAGKEGKIYLIDCNKMGHFNPNADNIVQELPAGTIGGSFDTPSYFNGHIYYVGVGDNAKEFSISNAQLSAGTTSQSLDGYGFPGATVSISANGSNNGIVWAVDNGSGELRAYNANNLANEIYTSDQAPNSRDQLGSSIKFAVPTVANGHVYVGTDGALVVYSQAINVTETVSGTTLNLTKVGNGNVALTVTHAAGFQLLTITAGANTVLNGSQSSITTSSAINRIVLSLGAGNDTFTIDGTANGTITLPGGLSITGTSGNKTTDVLSTNMPGASLSVSLTGNGAESSTFTDVSVGAAVTFTHLGTGSTSVTINTSGNPNTINHWGSLSITNGVGADTNTISNTNFAGSVTINNGAGNTGDTSVGAGSLNMLSSNLGQALSKIGGSLSINTTSGQSDTEIDNYDLIGGVTIGTGSGIKNQVAGNFVGIQAVANFSSPAGPPTIDGNVTINGSAVAGASPGLTIALGAGSPLRIEGTLTVNATGSGSVVATLQDLQVGGKTTVSLGNQTQGDTVSVQGSATTAMFNSFALMSSAIGANTFNIQDQAGETDFDGAVSYQLTAGNNTLNLAADSGNPSGVSGAVADFFSTGAFSGGPGTNSLFEGTLNTNLFVITPLLFSHF